MAKFRLAVFNTQPPHLYFGGVERRILEVTKRLAGNADISVYCGTKAGFKEPTERCGVKIVPCRSTDRLYPLDNWSFNRSLVKAVKEIEADIYEAHAVSGYGFVKVLKRQGIKKPFIHVVHGVLADEYEQAKLNGYASLRSRAANYFMHGLAKHEAETARNANLIVTISKYSLEKMKQHYGVDAKKVRIVPNGVAPEKFKPSDKAAARQQFGLGSEPCVLFVGSLIPRKGLPFLVQAAKKIVKEDNAVKFLVVGEGPLKAWFESTLASENLTENFRFLGNLKETQLPTVYNCADVFALPSIQEGQGIVLLEAEASAVPVVAFDVGGVGEAVRSGETGYLAHLGNIEEFTDAILRLLSDSVLRAKMGAAGRAFVIDNYTWDICAQRMLRVYEEALGI